MFAHCGRVLKKGRQGTLEQIERTFDNDVLPTLGKSSIYAIKRHDLLDVLAKIERRRAYTVAEKVRTWMKQLFRLALVKAPGLEQNPASDLDVVAAPKPPVTHNPFLRVHELPGLFSHADPDKVSSAYNHAEYVEPRRRMMQDWADRLDLCGQGEVEAATRQLTIYLDGVAMESSPIDKQQRTGCAG